MLEIDSAEMGKNPSNILIHCSYFQLLELRYGGTWNILHSSVATCVVLVLYF